MQKNLVKDVKFVSTIKQKKSNFILKLTTNCKIKKLPE